MWLACAWVVCRPERHGVVVRGESLSYQMGIHRSGGHRSLDDACATLALLRAMAEERAPSADDGA